MAIKDETGKRYGRLLVVAYHSRSEGKAKHLGLLARAGGGA